MKYSKALVFVGLALSACTSVPDDAAPLSVSFAFSAANRCSAVSPAISVGGAPAGTASYKVSMTDLDVPTYNHGGGTVAASGGSISAGALKSFRGPCPPSGQHTYKITVLAIDGGGKVVGAGSASRKF